MPVIRQIPLREAYPRATVGPHASRRSAMRVPSVKRLLEKVQTALTAAVFAEDSEVEMARSTMSRARTDKPGDR